MATWITDVEQVLRADADWNDWDFLTFPYDARNSFSAQAWHQRVTHKPGPVILLENVQAAARIDLQRRLRSRVVVVCEAVADSTELWNVVVEARRRHLAGEPFLPRKFVVAVLLVRKLRHNNRWSGNSKGFMWVYDLAKGRGVDEKYKDIVEEVAEDLVGHGILVSKTSEGLQKYALNPNIRPAIHTIADAATFPPQVAQLEAALMRDPQQEPAAILFGQDQA